MAVGYLSSLFPDVAEGFEIDKRKAKYRHDPALWALDHLGLEFNEKQKDVADDLARGSKKSIAVRAGHGTGKSFLAAILACWWIDVHPIEHVFVASTAPSADQVSAILWREIRRFHELSAKRHVQYVALKLQGKDTGSLPDHRLPGYVTAQNQWKTDSGILIGQGRKPPDNKDEDSFQGIHGQFVLSIGDEAGGLREGMIDALANITSGVHCRRLLIGNPSNPNARFGDIFLDTTLREIDGVMLTLQDVWSLHHMSVFDNPTFHGGGKCDCERHHGQPFGLGMSTLALESLSDPSYVHDKTVEYGNDSARYKVRVLGEFAHDAGDNLFTDFEIGTARDAIAWVDYESRETTTVLGVDVARSKFGDTTYVYRFTTGLMHNLDPITGEPHKVSDRVGGELRYVDSYRGVPLTDRYEVDGSFTIGQATLIDQHARDLNATEIRVDSGGLGIGLVDGLMLLARGKYRIIEMQGGGPTPDGRQWINNRAYQFAQMAGRFGAGTIDIDPTDKVLIGQLEDILVEYVDPHNALKIESKASMKKRGVKSPDAADAAWYACADLAHLDGPKNGDVITQTPAEILRRLDRSGFRDPYPM